jgi:hypothetical protein
VMFQLASLAPNKTLQPSIRARRSMRINPKRLVREACG